MRLNKVYTYKSILLIISQQLLSAKDPHPLTKHSFNHFGLLHNFPEKILCEKWIFISVTHKRGLEISTYFSHVQIFSRTENDRKVKPFDLISSPYK